MSYRDALVALTEQSERRVVAAYTAFLDGTLTRQECVQVIATLLAAGNGQATALANLAYASEVMAELGTPVGVGAVTPPQDLDRLEKAATTVLQVAQASPVPAAIVGRLARAEPLESASTAYTDAMVRSGKSKGWVRQRSAGCCQLCTWWWREGRVWPAEHPFQRHKGCTCTPKPVIRNNIRETGYTAQQKGIR